MNPFVLYLDIEHPLALLNRKRRAAHLKSVRRDSEIFRRLSRAGCMSQSFIWLDGSHLDELPLVAIVISGNRTNWEKYTPSQLQQPYEAIRSSSVPILGICGGHQLVCRALGGKVGPMRRLSEGEPDPYPRYMPGYFKERGYAQVDIRRQHELFSGLRDRVIVHQSHYCEVKDAPDVLEVLADSPNCRIQAVAHREKPIFGVQFHPETFDEAHQDGRKVLENFFRIARSARR